jgi:tetratricopeptide (TPR) repeat protein
MLAFRPLPFVSQVDTLEEALALPDDQLDVGYLGLLVSRLADPELKLEPWLERLDQYARSVLARLGSDRATARQAVAAIAEELSLRDYDYVEGGLSGVDPRNAYLAQLLSLRRGYCLSLSLLYLAIAERIGLDGLRLVECPDHAFVRYERDAVRFNSEPTAAGREFSDDQYRQRHPFPASAADDYLIGRSARSAVALALMTHGLVRWVADDLVGARAGFEQALRWVPGHLSSRYNLAGVELREGRYAPAQELYEHYLERRSDHALAWFGLARCALRRGDFERTRSALASARQRDPRSPEVPLLEAELALAAGDLAAAQQTAKRLTTLEGRFLLARVHLQRGERVQAMQVLRKLIRERPAVDAPPRLLARILVEDGHPDQAAAVLEALLQHQPNSAPTWADLARLRRVAGQHRAAADALQRALALDTSEPSWFIDLANALVEIGEEREAATWVGRGSDRHPGDRQLARLAVEVLRDLLGDEPAARPYLERYRALGGLELKD